MLMALVFPDSQGPGAAPRQPDTVSLPERANEGKTVPGSEAEQQAHGQQCARHQRAHEREGLKRSGEPERRGLKDQ